MDRPRELRSLLRLGDPLDEVVLERWMGWWIVVAGIGLVVARFVWTSGVWGVGYALFWLWVIVVCIRLIRRPDRWSSAAR